MNTRRLAVAALAALMALTLGGCERDADDPNSGTSLYYKEFITKDGRHIQCAAISGGHGYSGLSCDWEHPLTGKETK